MFDPRSPFLSCLTVDLIASREHLDRSATQARLEDAIDQVNHSLSAAIVVPFSVTLGDEWQGLLDSPAAALEADFLFRDLLHPLPVASGVGTGGVSTPLRERTPLMDGPCFHRAREAIGQAKDRRGQATVLASSDPLLDEAVNALCLLLHSLADRWTPKQLQSLRAYVAHGTEAAAATALGVTQPTLHQSLDRSQAKLYLEARDALLHFVSKYPLGASASTGAPL